MEYLNVCDNLADHMVGNVYAKFRWVAIRGYMGLWLECEAVLSGLCMFANWECKETNVPVTRLQATSVGARQL